MTSRAVFNQIFFVYIFINLTKLNFDSVLLCIDISDTVLARIEQN